MLLLIFGAFTTILTLYYYQIRFSGNFSIEIYENSENISNKFDIIGETVLGKEEGLRFFENAWHNYKNQNYKILHIKTDQYYVDTENLKIVIVFDSNSIEVPPNRILLKENVLLIEGDKKNGLKNTMKASGFWLITFIILLIFFGKIREEKNSISKRWHFIFIKYFFYTWFALLFLNIIYLSQFAFPNAEDIEITYELLNIDNPLFYLYTTMDGRYFSNLLYMLINPLYYGLPFQYYKIIPSTLFIITCLSFFYLISSINQKSENNLFLTAILTVSYYSFIPDLPAAMFFMAAAYHYAILPVLLSLLIAEIIRYIKNNSTGTAIKIIVLIIAFNGINEFAPIVSAILVVLLWIIKYNKGEKADYTTLSFTIIMIITGLIIILSPGNFTRIQSQSNPAIGESSIIFKAGFMILSSAYNTIIIIIEKFIRSPHLIILTVFLFIGLTDIANIQLPKNISRKRIIKLFLVLNFLIFVIIPLPYFTVNTGEGLGQIGHGFYMNLIWFLFILINSSLIFLFVKKFKFLNKGIYNQFFQSKLIHYIFVFSLPLSLVFSESIFSRTLVDTRTDLLHKHYEEIKSRHNYIYAENGNCNIYIREIKNKPISLHHPIDHYNHGSHIIGLKTIENFKYRNFYEISEFGDTSLVISAGEVIFHTNYLNGFRTKRSFFSLNEAKSILKRLCLYKANGIPAYYERVDKNIYIDKLNICFCSENGKLNIFTETYSYLPAKKLIINFEIEFNAQTLHFYDSLYLISVLPYSDRYLYKYESETEYCLDNYKFSQQDLRIKDRLLFQ